MTLTQAERLNFFRCNDWRATPLHRSADDAGQGSTDAAGVELQSRPGERLGQCLGCAPVQIPRKGQDRLAGVRGRQQADDRVGCSQGVLPVAGQRGRVGRWTLECQRLDLRRRK
jgi:hypothetical protein